MLQAVNEVEAVSSTNVLCRRRYGDDVTSYLEVLNTETSSFNAALSRSNVQQRYLSSIIQLYKALGGGWEIPESVELANRS